MAQSDFDPYAVLGVPPSATPAEIKAAYRKGAAMYHPDRHQDNPLKDLAAAKLVEINRAYEILSDPARRAEYDARHSPWPGPGQSPFGGRNTGVPGRRGRSWAYLLALILLLPLVIRFGAGIGRLIARLFRLVMQGFAAARGTPLLLAILLVAIAAGLFFFLRRRRR